MKDREKLIDALQKLQTRLNELHIHTEAITSERDNLAAMYTQVWGLNLLIVADSRAAKLAN